MRIVAAEILTVRLPFRLTFRHALAARSESVNVFVRLEDDEGRIGFGECAPRGYVTGETPSSVRDRLKQTLPRLVASTYHSFQDVVDALRGELNELDRDAHAAFCAQELAILDLAGHAFGVSVVEVVGPVRSKEVAYSAVVSADDIESVRDTCELTKSFGITDVKLKVGLSEERDLEILQTAREILGDAVSLRVDANCAWTAEEALGRIEAFAPFRLDGVEQPLPADDIDGLSWLTARSGIPIILDESLVSMDDARELARRAACHVFNIRISKCGGLLNATRIRDLANENGIGCILGAQVGETAILSAAGRQFAVGSTGLRFLEGSFGSMLLSKDIGREGVTIKAGGLAPALMGTGLGIGIDEARLASLVEERTSVDVTA